MGLVQWKAGRLAEATQTLETCYQRQDEMRYRVGQSATMTNLGVIAEARNNLDEALEWYEQSLRLNQTLGDKQGITILLGNLASVYLVHGEFDQAWSYTERALEQAEEIGDRASLAIVANTRSELHRYRNQLSAAREAAVDATEIAAEIEDREHQSTALYNDGRVALEDGQYERARDCFQEGFSLARDGGLDKQARENCAGLVDTHVHLNTPEEVSDETAKLERDEPLVSETVARARYEAAIGETDQAWETLSSRLDAIDEDSRQIAALKLHNAMARVADQRGDKELVQHNASRCLDRATEIGATLFAARSRDYLD
jgi:tetratricopeptide (TPR) repeat protein